MFNPALPIHCEYFHKSSVNLEWNYYSFIDNVGCEFCRVYRLINETDQEFGDRVKWMEDRLNIEFH